MTARPPHDPFDAVVETATRAALPAPETIRAAAARLGRSRGVVVVIANHTGNAMILRSERLAPGVGGDAAPALVERASHRLFAVAPARGGVVAGNEGTLIYGGHGFDVVLRWQVPNFGPRLVSAHVRGARAAAHRVRIRDAMDGSLLVVHLEVHAIDCAGFDVQGAILDAWAGHGWRAGALGAPVAEECDSADRGGRRQAFAGGVIVWRPDLGAQVVRAPFLALWQQLGAEAFGYPVGPERPCADGVGRVQTFRRYLGAGRFDGDLIWHPATGVQAVQGTLRRHWHRRGGEHGELGYPVGPERPRSCGGAGSMQAFQHGCLVFDPARGVARRARDPDDAHPDLDAVGTVARIALRLAQRQARAGRVSIAGAP